MALDKVIDSERLNSALRSTADAIRVHTGNTDAIPFNMDTGFAEAVGTIQSAGTFVLPYYTGEVVLTQVATYFDVHHGLGSTKLLAMVDALDLTATGSYVTYRAIVWPPELLTPHVRYPVGDMTTSPYVDETIPNTVNRTGCVIMQSGSATATTHWIASVNRTGTNGHAAALNYITPDYVQISLNNFMAIGTYRVTVIDISNAGIRFVEE